MKKLIYLIVAIVTLSLIIAGCGIPVVPPTEQNEPELLPSKNPGVLNVPTIAYPTIQAAINAASPDDIISVGAGTYDENLDINKQLTIQGVGKGIDPLTNTIIDPSSGSYGIYIHQPVNLKDLRVTGAPSHGIRIERSSIGRLDFSGVTWENIASSGNGERGVEIHNDTDVSNMVITNCEFVSNVAQGLRTASNVVVNGLVITDSTFNGNSYGIYLQGTINGVTILRSEFNNSTYYGGYMTETGPLTNLVIEDSEFNNNVFGLVIWNEQDNTDITITSTLFQNNDKDGVFIGGNTLADVLIQGSEVLNNDRLGLGYYGIDFNTDSGVMNNVAVHYTNITGHTFGGGVRNSDAVATAIVDATCNWWGDDSGPGDVGPGSGDAVTDYVNFCPWLDSAYPSGNCSGGAPVIEPIEISPNPVAQGTPTMLTANFTGPAGGTATIDWGDGSTTAEGVVDDGAGTVTGSYTYAEAGVYTVVVTLTTICGSSDPVEFQYAVVYDPSAGFVTGGGWIDSPAGASTQYPDAVGKASFGFVSKYKKGQSTPTGNTEFQFKAGDLNFHSDSYDWLVIAGAKAKFKGSGTINGAGNFGFMLSAIDEELTPSTDVDLFRIKIWDKDDGDAVVYDNNNGETDDADPATEIAGGQIVIHKAK